MTTLLTTFEYRVREWLLDLLHRQWRALGAPLSVSEPLQSDEAIDPEALLWCSLEFFPTQPRLREQALSWWATNNHSLLRPRIRKFAKARPDPRALIWHVLDPESKAPKQLSEPCYGQKSVQDLLEFCDGLGKKARTRRVQRQQTGAAEKTTATAILRARAAVGADAKHFILVYLLANRGGAKLRSIADWSGQSYRNIFKVAQRWESGDILKLEHGYARLTNVTLWAKALSLDPNHIVLINWVRLYDACARLLRSFSKAAGKSIPADGPVVAGLIREASAEATASAEGGSSAGTIKDLTELLASLR